MTASEPSEGIERLVRSLLDELGEDPTRDGLQQTPARVARSLRYLLSGYHQQLETLVNGAIFEASLPEMVVVRDIEVYSLCEHHLLPFFGKAHVAYLPNGRILGLSKIPRIVDMFARRLQVQEQFTTQIADALQTVLEPGGVGVVIEASISAWRCAAWRSRTAPPSPHPSPGPSARTRSRATSS